MTCNIMSEYIKYTINFLRKFTKEFFREKNIPRASEQYIEAYVEARYLNYGGNKTQRVFYRRIYSALQEKNIEIKYNSDEEEHQTLDNMLELYQYIFYIDFVRPLNEDLRDFVSKMYEKRTIKFQMKKMTGQKENLYKMIKEFRKNKEEYIDKFDSEEFKLSIRRYSSVDGIYKVNLKYNFKLPYLFSTQAIEEVYNENIINEDKLMIEYILLTILNIRLILNGNFNTQYLVDFPITIFEKKQKMEQLLNILDNSAIQERISLKIKYKDFIEHKEEIYELMKKGYKFVVIIDEKFDINKDELRKLEIFKYVIVNKRSKIYENFKKYNDELENLVIDEE